MGMVNSKPIQQAKTPARLTKPARMVSPKTCHQCLFTILKLVFIAVPKFICWSTMRGSVNSQHTVRYVVGIRQTKRTGRALKKAGMSCESRFCAAAGSPDTCCICASSGPAFDSQT